jgi:hypothetical protein|tara:strand:+ start:1614 stop:3419 length:1806 start_codon:yes stop_codon:yes gene_type:complete
MSEVFKTFNKDDIQIRDFTARKYYTLTLSNYSASYNENTPFIIDGEAIVPKIKGYVAKADRFTEFNSGSEDLNTATLIPSRSVWDNLWQMYYRDWPNHGSVFCTRGDKAEHRELYDTAYVISVPHFIYGQGLTRESVTVSFPSVPAGETITLKDDGFGNLYNTAFATSSGLSVTSSIPPVQNTAIYLPFKDLTPYQYMPSYGKGYLNTQITSGSITDFSMYQNNVSSNNIKVVTGSKYGTGIEFTGQYGETGGIGIDTSEMKSINDWSYVKINPDYSIPQLDFREDEDFAISFYLNINSTQYTKDSFTNQVILSHEIPSVTTESILIGETENFTNGDGNFSYPFRIEIDNQGFINASRKDGSGQVATCQVETDFRDNAWRHIVFQKSGSDLDLYVNYSLSAGDTNDMVDAAPIRNNGAIVLGGQINLIEGAVDPVTNQRQTEPHFNRAFNGQIDEFRIFDSALSQEQINYMSSSVGTGMNHWGNVFYEHGQVVVTFPSASYLSAAPRESTISFRNKTTVTENLFSCEVKANELNFTANPSVIKNHKTKEISQYALNNEFNPYVTKIGLYNDAGELLVIGSLAQPIFKMVDYDMTFVVRYDT